MDISVQVLCEHIFISLCTYLKGLLGSDGIMSFYYSHPNGYEGMLHCSFICMSLLTCDEHLIMCLLAIFASSSPLPILKFDFYC